MFQILIVDDEYINRCMLREMLVAAGYEDVIEAGDGQSALEMAQEHTPDMVLLDVMMPGLSGLEVAPELKKFSPDCYLPILFITALDDQASLVKCLDAGGDDFISKPFDSVVLIAKIKAHERSRTMSLELAEKNESLFWYRQDVERNHRIVEHIFANAMAESETLDKHFSYYIQPETRFNGDVLLCEKSPVGGAYLFVGDFTGHGLASAIGAIPVAKAFTAMAKKGLAVEEIAAELNKILLEFLPADMFCVACIVEIAPSGTRFTVWNGGLPRLVVRDTLGNIRHKIESRHMPLGILGTHEFERNVEHVDAQEGDRLLVYTDGLMESTHPELGGLGEEGVEKWFSEHCLTSARAFVDLASEYRQGQPATDDITIVLYRCEPFRVINEPDINSVLLVPFKTEMVLTNQHLKHTNVADFIVQKLSNLEGLEAIRSEVFTVITELLNNAIEHGLLKLDSRLKDSSEGFEEYYRLRAERLEQLTMGHVKISLNCEPIQRLLTISVFDSGEGYIAEPVVDLSDDTHGRGLLLLEEFCESVAIEEGGRKTVVTLSF